MKKRLLSLLLTVLMLVSVFPTTGFATLDKSAPEAMMTSSDKGVESDCGCPMTDGIHYATCPHYTCPNCGTGPWHDLNECPADEEELPVDYSSDIGKYAKLNTAVTAITVLDRAIPVESTFYHEDFADGTILRITDCFFEAETGRLWYCVEFYTGGVVGTFAGGWPSVPWILQNDSNGNALVFVDCCSVCGRPDCSDDHTPMGDSCAVCGKTDCDGAHLYCEACGLYNCGLSHTFCQACGQLDCTKVHTFCSYCFQYDCGLPHTEGEKPASFPVIPENPTLTEGAAVSIVDASGAPVTEEGFYVPIGEKVSISAWSAAENAPGAAYRWQICYDSANDRWADIQGETGKGLLASHAMFYSIVQAQGETAIRCIITSGTEETVSQSIPIFLVEPISVAAVNSTATEGDNGVFAASFRKGQREREVTQFELIITYVLSENCKVPGRIVAQEHRGTYVSTEEREIRVEHPTVPGYQPVEAEAASGVTAEAYNRTFAAGTEGTVEVTVKYDPAEMNYLVVHYMQNVADNNYTEVLRETKTGITEHQVAADLQNPTNDSVSFDGFHALNYERPSIAADGSTVIEIYYDRIYYLISFELDGGYGVDPVFARYGATMPDVGEPTRAGYTFAGWSLDGETKAELPNTVPVGNRKYYALWSDPEQTKVTVVYWRENADDYGFSVWGQETVENITAGTVLDGVDYPATSMLTSGVEELPYFTLNKTKTDRSVEVLGDGSTTINVYYNRNVYSVYFYAVGTCGIREHTHSDVLRELICKEDHGHDPVDCYSGCRILICTEDHEHHAADCYRYDCGVTVHTHSAGTNCGTFKNPANGSGINKESRNLVHAITAKYEANISDIWPMPNIMAQLPTVHKNDAGQASHTNGTPFRAWQIGSSSSDPTVSLRATMNYGVCDSADGIKDAYALYATGATLQLRYMVKSFDQTSPSNAPNRILYNKVYYDVMPEYSQTVVVSATTPSNSSFNHKTIAGLNFNSSHRKLGDKLADGSNYFYLFYTRRNFTVTFKNAGDDYLVAEKVPWGTSLSNYSIMDENGNWVSYAESIANPTYPSDWEEGVYEFGGWYTTSNFYEGTKYLFDADDTMPANDLTLFAKWIPVTHTVTFYRTYADMQNDIQLPQETHPTQNLYHGTFLGRINDATRDGYYFVNWFYIDEATGEEKAFAPENMPVTNDLKLYANWTSTVTVEYQVHFRSMVDGSVVDVADGITGKSFAGYTMTFDAKVGGALYPDYQQYYFPAYESQSMNLKQEEGAVNEIVFWYDRVESIPYTVRYLNTETGNNVFDGIELPDKIVTDNYQAAVTEDYVPIEGYLPDNSRKTLVLTSDTAGSTDRNVLIFLYTKTVTEGPVRRTHYIEELNGGWSEYDFSEEIGTFGESYTEKALTDISGFTYSITDTQANQRTQAPGTAVTVVTDSISGTLADHTGLYLDLYYTRNEYPYEVRYVEEGTYNTVAASVKGFAPYQALLTQNAKEIDGYTCVSAETQTIPIKIEKGETAVVNVITFLYERHMSTLIISKEVSATPAGSAPVEDTFEFTVKLIGAGEDNLASAYFPQPMYGFDIYHIGDDPATAKPLDGGIVYPTALENGSAVKDSFKLSIKAGQYALLKGLPTGSYTITEADYTTKDYAVVPAQTVTLEEEKTTRADFVNLYSDRTFDLKVTNIMNKSYVGDTLPDDTFSFTLVLTPDTSTKNIARDYYWQIVSVDGNVQEERGTVEITETSESFTFTLANGETAEFFDLPIGSYTITEADDHAANYMTTVNGNEGYTASDTVTAMTNTLATVTFVNTYQRHLWDLTITTTAADSEQSFLFSVTGTPDAPGAGMVSLKVVLVGTDSVTIRDLPIGVYTVAEADGWSWRETAIESKTVELREQSVTIPAAFGLVDRLSWISGYDYDLRKKGGK